MEAIIVFYIMGFWYLLLYSFVGIVIDEFVSIQGFYKLQEVICGSEQFIVSLVGIQVFKGVDFYIICIKFCYLFGVGI